MHKLKATRFVSAKNSTIHAVIFVGSYPNISQLAENPFLNTMFKTMFEEWAEEQNISSILGVQVDGVLFENREDALMTYLAFA